MKRECNPELGVLVLLVDKEDSCVKTVIGSPKDLTLFIIKFVYNLSMCMLWLNSTRLGSLIANQQSRECYANKTKSLTDCSQMPVI